MIEMQDCPSCGTMQIRTTVRVCDVCEISERYEAKLERAEARVAELESQLSGVEQLERMNEDGYERDIRALQARVSRLEGMIRKLVHDYEHPSDETYTTTLDAAASLVGAASVSEDKECDECGMGGGCIRHDAPGPSARPETAVADEFVDMSNELKIELAKVRRTYKSEGYPDQWFDGFEDCAEMMLRELKKAQERSALVTGGEP